LTNSSQQFRETSEAMPPDEIDGVTLRCMTLIREVIRLQRVGAKEQVPRSQVSYDEPDVEA
jgi:hypothetical protein